ncbi:MAG TPA: peptide deformylase [Acidimicrobiales bacterium]|nr:peptide deformylase [Acidimicrobiales bacterium]
MGTHTIRVHGDPVLRQPTQMVTEIDGVLARLVEDMIETMHAAPGVGLAANQVGVQKRLFVWDVGQGPSVAINPVVSGHAGEWTYDEGCLSVPGLFWPIVRPKHVHLDALDLDGNEVSIDADEILARVFLHETDHLDGVLLLERLDPQQRKEAKRALRERALHLDAR